MRDWEQKPGRMVSGKQDNGEVGSTTAERHGVEGGLLEVSERGTEQDYREASVQIWQGLTARKWYVTWLGGECIAAIHRVNLRALHKVSDWEATKVSEPRFGAE